MNCESLLRTVSISRSLCQSLHHATDTLDKRSCVRSLDFTRIVHVLVVARLNPGFTNEIEIPRLSFPNSGCGAPELFLYCTVDIIAGNDLDEYVAELPDQEVTFAMPQINSMDDVSSESCSWNNRPAFVGEDSDLSARNCIAICFGRVEHEDLEE